MDTMTAAFGNTVRVTQGADSYDAHYNPDGSFSNTLGLKGQWTLQGETLTLLVDGAPIGSTTLPSGKVVGDSWTMKDQNGQDAVVALVAGR